MRTLLSELVATNGALERCKTSGNKEWTEKHSEHLKRLVDNLPSGSGFDNGTQIELLSDTKAVFLVSFHHMDGWTDHTVTVKPTFSGLSISVSGKNKNDIKEYIAETFYQALSEEVNEKGEMLSMLESSRKWKEAIENGTAI